MRQDQRAPFVEALEKARVEAYPPGEFVGQESFMRASEILALAHTAGIGRDTRVLDLCCGIAGPGRLVTAEFHCDYLGVDYSDSAIAIARERAASLPCSFEVGLVPPVPAGPFDVVMLLETILAFADKADLLRHIVATLAPGGRLLFTLEEGRPLTPAEREAMPDADTVWLTPLEEMIDLLHAAGLQVVWQDECSGLHLEIVDSLIASFEANQHAVADQIGQLAFDELLTAHRLWHDWLRTGRVRKFAFVAVRASA